jgi:hypothetical protein
MAYLDFDFDDAWRVEHGLSAIMHGARVVAVGGYGDTRHASARDGSLPAAEGDEAPTRTRDGARIAARWIEHPHDAVVALPMWAGLLGRWDVRFVYEDDEELELTREQHAAAELLIEDGDAIRDALLARLFASYQKSAAPSSAIKEPSGLAAIVEARRLRVHAEDSRGTAYTEFSVVAPWRKAGKATVLMNGTRVVALTTKAGVEDAIADDQEAALRARRTAKAKRKKPRR